MPCVPSSACQSWQFRPSASSSTKPRGRLPFTEVVFVRAAGGDELGHFFEDFDLPELLRATAWRMSALKVDSSTSSPSWMSIARRVFPSRLELKSRAGSFRDAPLEKVSFTRFL